eukprot:1149862-Pelagomonas_calceolata.AAC.9
MIVDFAYKDTTQGHQQSFSIMKYNETGRHFQDCTDLYTLGSVTQQLIAQPRSRGWLNNAAEDSSTIQHLRRTAHRYSLKAGRLNNAADEQTCWTMHDGSAMSRRMPAEADVQGEKKKCHWFCCKHTCSSVFSQIDTREELVSGASSQASLLKAFPHLESFVLISAERCTGPPFRHRLSCGKQACRHPTTNTDFKSGSFVRYARAIIMRTSILENCTAVRSEAQAYQ